MIINFTRLGRALSRYVSLTGRCARSNVNFHAKAARDFVSGGCSRISETIHNLCDNLEPIVQEREEYLAQGQERTIV